MPGLPGLPLTLPPSMRPLPPALVPLAGLLLVLGGAPAWAEPAIFKDADLGLGRKLIQDHRCDACHAQKRGGDPFAIYRPGQRLKTAGHLRGMVEQCNTELNLGLFPEEVSAVAAVLNREHYRFAD